MKIALISPKGPLYRHRGGIFGKSLRYQPLTLPTLAALVPEELNATVELFDEGAESLPSDLAADLVGMTVITGNAPRAYALSRELRSRGVPVVLGGPHVTLMPEEAAEHADAVCVGYAEDAWPQLLRDFAGGGMRRVYRQAEDFSLARGLPRPRRDLLSPKRYLTQAVFESGRSCVHDCDFCVAPTAWGSRLYKKDVASIVADIEAVGLKQILFIDLNLISDISYARELFTALIPLNVEWFGLSTVLIAHEPELMELMARSGCKGLLLGFETLNGSALGERGKGFNASVDYARLLRDLHELGVSVQGCFVFGSDNDTPESFERTAELRHRAGDRPATVFHPDALSGNAAFPAVGGRGAHPHAGLGAVRRPARRLPAAAHDAGGAAPAARAGLAQGLRRFRHGAAAAQRGQLLAAQIEPQHGIPLLRPQPEQVLHLRRPDGGERGGGEMKPATRVTLIHPAMGHRDGGYIRAWQMETLPIASLAGLTPKDVALRFFDDRMEKIDYDAPCDAVAISVETYTAKRAYAIAAEYRRRGVPVIMGGFHATLLPEEVERHADATIVGEAEELWPEVLEDVRRGSLKRRYASPVPPSLDKIRVDRSVFAGKNYLPVTLVETGRGCRYACEFCAVGAFFSSSRRQRPVGETLREIAAQRGRTKLFFFVDDNFAAEPEAAKELMRGLLGEKVKWVTQMSLPAALDEDFLALMRNSGCQGVLVGIESLDEGNLAAMNKRFNVRARAEALANLRKYDIGVYATFVFGYDGDRRETFDEAVDFAIGNEFFIAAFNHLTPFPGTPLHDRLAAEGRMRFDAWWLDERYCYNDLAFQPKRLEPEEVSRLCVAARNRFYSWRSIVRRMNRANLRGSFKLKNYFPVNLMHKWDVRSRDGYPLGN